MNADVTGHSFWARLEREDCGVEERSTLYDNILRLPHWIVWGAIGVISVGFVSLLGRGVWLAVAAMWGK